MLQMTKCRNWHHLTAVQSCSHSPWIMRIVTHFQDRGDKPDVSPKAASLILSKNVLKISGRCHVEISCEYKYTLYIIVYICTACVHVHKTHSDLGHLADNCPLWWNKSLWSIFMNYILHVNNAFFITYNKEMVECVESSWVVGTDTLSEVLCLCCNDGSRIIPECFAYFWSFFCIQDCISVLVKMERKCIFDMLNVCSLTSVSTTTN